MDTSGRTIRLGLFGASGAGKSTACQIIQDYCDQTGVPGARIKLAEPLYEAQSAIYEIAGKRLHDFYEQDGELLNFLGYYLRKLNPRVLIDRFSIRLSGEIEKLTDLNRSNGVIICDDMRRPDASFLKSKGFLFVQIMADTKLCEQRRRERGDRTLGASTHSTEQGLAEITPDYVVENNETIADLQIKLIALMDGLHHDLDRKKNTA